MNEWPDHKIQLRRDGDAWYWTCTCKQSSTITLVREVAEQQSEKHLKEWANFYSTFHMRGPNKTAIATTAFVQSVCSSCGEIVNTGDPIEFPFVMEARGLFHLNCYRELLT